MYFPTLLLRIPRMVALSIWSLSNSRQCGISLENLPYITVYRKVVLQGYRAAAFQIELLGKQDKNRNIISLVLFLALPGGVTSVLIDTLDPQAEVQVCTYKTSLEDGPVVQLSWHAELLAVSTFNRKVVFLLPQGPENADLEEVPAPFSIAVPGCTTHDKVDVLSTTSFPHGAVPSAAAASVSSSSSSATCSTSSSFSSSSSSASVASSSSSSSYSLSSVRSVSASSSNRELLYAGVSSRSCVLSSARKVGTLCYEAGRKPFYSYQVKMPLYGFVMPRCFHPRLNLVKLKDVVPHEYWEVMAGTTSDQLIFTANKLLPANEDPRRKELRATKAAKLRWHFFLLTITTPV
jgi:hypothetical protein